MKILKKGKDMTASKHTEAFVCPVCGCEFEASEDEYWIELGQIENMHCNCPQCHARCFTLNFTPMPTITLNESSK